MFVLPKREERVVPEGPYHVGLSIRDKRLIFDVNTEKCGKSGRVSPVARPLSPSGQRLLPDLRKLL